MLIGNQNPSLLLRNKHKTGVISELLPTLGPKNPSMPLLVRKPRPAAVLTEPQRASLPPQLGLAGLPGPRCSSHRKPQQQKCRPEMWMLAAGGEGQEGAAAKQTLP